MPYKSEAQRKYFNANREKLEAEGVDVDEWNESSKGKKLPEKAESSKEKAAGLLNDLLGRPFDRAKKEQEEQEKLDKAVARNVRERLARQIAKEKTAGDNLDNINPVTFGGLGAVAGAGLGGLAGLMTDPGEDEEGKKKSRLLRALAGAGVGGLLGGGLGAGGFQYLSNRYENDALSNRYENNAVNKQAGLFYRDLDKPRSIQSIGQEVKDATKDVMPFGEENEGTGNFTQIMLNQVRAREPRMLTKLWAPRADDIYKTLVDKMDDLAGSDDEEGRALATDPVNRAALAEEVLERLGSPQFASADDYKDEELSSTGDALDIYSYDDKGNAMSMPLEVARENALDLDDDKVMEALHVTTKPRSKKQLKKEAVFGTLIGGPIGAGLGARKADKEGRPARHGAEEGFLRGMLTGGGAGVGTSLGLLGSAALMKGKPSTGKGVLAALLPLLGAGVGGYAGWRGGKPLVDQIKANRQELQDYVDESKQDSDIAQEESKMERMESEIENLAKAAAWHEKRAIGWHQGKKLLDFGTQTALPWLGRRLRQAWDPQTVGKGGKKLGLGGKLEAYGHHLGQPLAGGVGGWHGADAASRGLTGEEAGLEQKVIGALGGAVGLSPAFRSWARNKGMEKYMKKGLKPGQSGYISPTQAQTMGLASYGGAGLVGKAGLVAAPSMLHLGAGALKDVKDVTGQLADDKVYTVTGPGGEKIQLSGKEYKQLKFPPKPSVGGGGGGGGTKQTSKPKTDFEKAQELVTQGKAKIQESAGGVKALQQAGATAQQGVENLESASKEIASTAKETGPAAKQLTKTLKQVGEASGEAGTGFKNLPTGKDINRAVESLERMGEGAARRSDDLIKRLDSAGDTVKKWAPWVGGGLLAGGGLYGLYKIMESRRKAKEEEKEERRRMLYARPDSYPRLKSAGVEYFRRNMQ